MWWPSDCETPRKPSQRTGITSISSSSRIFFALASMSSPIRPIGHSDWTEIPFASGKSARISRPIISSRCAPP